MSRQLRIDNLEDRISVLNRKLDHLARQERRVSYGKQEYRDEYARVLHEVRIARAELEGLYDDLCEINDGALDFDPDVEAKALLRQEG